MKRLLAFSLVLVLAFTLNALAVDNPNGSTDTDNESIWASIIARGISPGTIEGRLELAIAYANTGQLEDAFDLFQGMENTTEPKAELNELVVRLESATSLLDLNKRAFAYYVLSDFANSLVCFEQAIAMDSNNVWLRHFAALTYYKSSNLQKAMDHLQYALGLDKSNEYTHLLLGMAYYEKRNYVQALYHYFRSPNARKKIAEYSL